MSQKRERVPILTVKTRELHTKPVIRYLPLQSLTPGLHKTGSVVLGHVYLTLTVKEGNHRDLEIRERKEKDPRRKGLGGIS